MVSVAGADSGGLDILADPYPSRLHAYVMAARNLPVSWLA